MKVSFYENGQFICAWENHACIPIIGDVVALETETDKAITRRLYIVVNRIISKDFVYVICEYDECETIIPKPNNNG